MPSAFTTTFQQHIHLQLIALTASSTDWISVPNSCTSAAAFSLLTLDLEKLEKEVVMIEGKKKYHNEFSIGC